MDIRQLRYFLAVAQELHFGRAAERVHIAQSPLSRQIKQLEDTLGVVLFRRTKRHVELTDAGRALMPEAQAILDATEQARRTVVNAGAGMIGRLRVGFTSASVYTSLPQILFEYRSRYPQVELVLRDSAITSVQVEGLLNKNLDIGFLRPPVGDLSIGLMPVAYEQLMVALPATHPLAEHPVVEIKSLAAEPFVVFSRSIGSSLSTVIHRTCLDAGFQVKVAQEARDIPTMIMLVAGGMGVSLVPSSSCSMGIKGVVFREIAGPKRKLEIALGWNKGVESAIRDGFIDVVRSVLGGGAGPTT
jgi:DNA-binding transcriptional LysR family regulator